MHRIADRTRTSGTCLLACAGLLLGGGTALSSSIASADPGRDRDAIVHALQDSAAAWSRRDLEGFMRVYAAAPSTSYVKGNVVLHGYEAIRTMYAQRFDDRSRLPGQLSLQVLEVRPLGPDYALCIGRFALLAPATHAVSNGMFTLVFQRLADHWKIVSDHTAS